MKKSKFLYIRNEIGKKFINFIREKPRLGWHWDEISKNPNITFDIIQENPDLNWDWEEISKNPNITIDFIKENLNKDSVKWNWQFISQNPFTKEYNDLEEKYTKAVKKIENWWLEVNYNPVYRKCQDKIYEEYTKLYL